MRQRKNTKYEGAWRERHCSEPSHGRSSGVLLMRCRLLCARLPIGEMLYVRVKKNGKQPDRMLRRIRTRRSLLYQKYIHNVHIGAYLWLIPPPHIINHKFVHPVFANSAGRRRNWEEPAKPRRRDTETERLKNLRHAGYCNKSGRGLPKDEVQVSRTSMEFLAKNIGRCMTFRGRSSKARGP